MRARPEPTQLEHLSDTSIVGKLLVFPANVGLDWKVIASTNTLAYFASSTAGFEHLIQGILKGGSITVPLTTCLTHLDWCVLQIKTKIVSCHTANSKPVKQEVNGTVILPLLVFPGYTWQQPEAVFLVVCDPPMNEL